MICYKRQLSEGFFSRLSFFAVRGSHNKAEQHLPENETMLKKPTTNADKYHALINRTTPLLFVTLVAVAFPANVGAAERPSVDKTLVAWVIPANLTQRGGSVLTIQSGDQFDAIVFGEKVAGRWMAGSNSFRRTPANQGGWPAETAGAKTAVQIAIVYESGDIRIYRNGKAYATYKTKNIDLLSTDHQIAVFGLRHLGGGSSFGNVLAGEIEDARIYARALTQDQIAALKPNVKSKIDPLAWWDFEGDKVIDRGGRFGHSAMTGGVKLAGGRLVLNGEGYLVAARSEADAKKAIRGRVPRAPGPPYVPETPAWPKNPPANWLTFHLAHPGPGNAYPGDPNCVFDYKGRYHLHYIYRNRTGFVFAHVSSDDMVRWKWHPTVLAPPTTGHGMFSGTGFYTTNGKPAIIYHGQGSGRNWIQYALDDQFNKWSDPEPVLPKTADGKAPKMRHWDPDCWLNGKTYYALSGGGNPPLLKSPDLKKWTYLGDLLHKDYPAKQLGIAKGEDISCANMFKIGNKWMLLCISHRLGCRYYLGDFKDEKYLPESHAMMSFGNNMLFAPESMLTRDGRRVMWAWLLKVPAAPTGLQCLPRELELSADGVLHIKPLRELASLRHDEKSWKQLRIKDGAEHGLDGLTGDAIEIEVTFASPIARECGVHLLGDADGKNGISIVAGADRKSLSIGTIKAPFELTDNEDLTLRVFIDKNLVEVFANDRQAAVFAHRYIRKNPSIRLFANGSDVAIKSIKTWKIKSIY
jgi:beta-fructofuranosidase